MKWTRFSSAQAKTPIGPAHCGSNSVHRRGFTLIELLVATAILAVVLGILATLTTATDQSILASNQIVDATAQSRIAFDRIGRDLVGIVKRADVDFQAQNPTPGTDSNILLFFSSISSASELSANNRGVSLVGYRVYNNANNGNRPCLVRAGMSLGWNSSGSMVPTNFMGLKSNGLPTAMTDIPAALQPADSDFDILSAGTIRMVVGFQLYPDNQQATLSDGTSIAHSTGRSSTYRPSEPSLLSGAALPSTIST